MQCFLDKFILILSSCLLFSCNENKPPPIHDKAISNNASKKNTPAHLGGATTVFETSRKAFTLSSRNLEEKHKSAFFLGNSLFNKNWIQAPGSADARDGLGPLYIARSCSGCHTQDGRGRPPIAEEQFVSLLFRLSVKDHEGNWKPHSTFGNQLQTRSLSNQVKEPNINVQYQITQGKFDDQSPYELEKPIYSLSGENTVSISPRVAQAVIGLGLLEAIPESQLRSWADPQDKDNDGISGRINLVPDLISKQKSVGKFGWKANQPNIHQQVAAAFQGDLGITSSLFPNENHSAQQAKLLDSFPSGGNPEISDKLLQAVVTYCQTLAVPAQREPQSTDVIAGEKIFHHLNCNSCHKSEVTTGAHSIISLSFQKIRPFTDLLLHDMGPGLADGRPDGEASGSEWRTAPLWGIGLVETVNKHTRFLHDGRARNIEEAILWHGGEAEESKINYTKLEKKNRQKLLHFLRSL